MPNQPAVKTQPPSEAVPATAHAPHEPTFAQRLMRSFAWEGGGQTAGQLITWASTLVVIRLLTPVDYGLMAMATLLFGFFIAVADLGVGFASVQARSIERTQLRGIFGLVISTNLACAAITFLTAPLVAQFFGDPRITPLARVLSLNFLILPFSALPSIQLVRRMDFRTKARIDIQASVAGAL